MRQNCEYLEMYQVFSTSKIVKFMICINFYGVNWNRDARVA